MPNTTALTINDGLADTVFTPEGISSTHVLFQDVAEERLDLRALLHFDRPSNGKGSRGTSRRTVRLNKPSERVVDGITVPKQSSARVEFVFDVSDTIAERKALRIAMANALLNASSSDVIDNSEWFY